MKSDGKCALCGWFSCHIMHILGGCKFSLMQGRFTWRHDNVLTILHEAIAVLLERQNKVVKLPSLIERNSITFCKPGEKPGKTQPRLTLLQSANDWRMLADLGSTKDYIFPEKIAASPLRPDELIFSEMTKTLIMIELSIVSEDLAPGRHKEKTDKYAELVTQCMQNGWKVFLFAIEMGSRGLAASSLYTLRRQLGLEKLTIWKMSKMALRCSYVIYLHRSTKEWLNWNFQLPHGIKQ